MSSPPEGAPALAVWNTYIWVEDADEASAKAREAGGSVLSEPFDVMEAGRTAVLADPELRSASGRRASTGAHGSSTSRAR